MKGKLSKLSYWSLFAHTFLISIFAVGGGYVMIPIFKERFVEKLGWLDMDELTTLMAIGQSSPGALIINTSVLMGYRLLGVGGAVAAAAGTALPSVLIIMLVAVFYDLIKDNFYVGAAFKGMRAGVAAIIADTVLSLAAPYFRRDKVPYICIMSAAFAAAFFLDINVGFIIAGCVLLGVVIGLFRRKRRSAE